MGLQGNKPVRVNDWNGLDSRLSVENLDTGWWTSCANVVVDNQGAAQVLRSPASFNTALAVGTPILSAFDYPKNTGNLILFDIDVGGTVTTYSTTGTANASVRTGQAAATPWVSLYVNDWAYRINGSEFIQTNGTNTYTNGITAPAAAPTLSFVAGGSAALGAGVTVSVAYRNSATGHVSAASPASTNSGASGANQKLRIALTASVQTGVDGIVLFISADGGAVRYSYLVSGVPSVQANSTANVDIDIALLKNLDILTPETTYNGVAPTTGKFMFRWKDRVLVCGFTGATTKQQIQYNVRENCYYGNPWESWWVDNIIPLTNKSDAARAGIETPIGALVLGEQDSYLIRGTLSDAISSPQQTVSVTYQIQPLGWSIGTRSPKSLKQTPFGPVWLDQDKRLQMWNESAAAAYAGGGPVEIGLAIRSELKAIQDSDSARGMVEGTWYAHGDQGGIYVLTGSTTGTTNNVSLWVSMVRGEDGHVKFACGKGTAPLQCLCAARVSGAYRLFAGGVNALFEIGDFTKAGAGWAGGTTLSFATPIGNDTAFSYFQSLMFDASDITGLTITVTDTDGTNSVTLSTQQNTGSGPTNYVALINQYGRRKLVTFTFSTTDTTQRVIKNLTVNKKPTGRTM